MASLADFSPLLHVHDANLSVPCPMSSLDCLVRSREPDERLTTLASDPPLARNRSSLETQTLDQLHAAVSISMEVLWSMQEYLGTYRRHHRHTSENRGRGESSL